MAPTVKPKKSTRASRRVKPASNAPGRSRTQPLPKVPFKFFDHTADVMFEAYGKTLAQAIENAAQAMFDVTCHLPIVKAKSKAEPKAYAPRTISLALEAEDEGGLLAEVLSQLVGESDAEEIFFTRLETTKLIQDPKSHLWVFEGVAHGVPFFPEASRTHVKAVTRSSFTTVEKTKTGYTAKVLLDI